MRVLVTEHVARVLDNRRLHSKTYAEVGHVVLAGVFRANKHSLHAAGAEAAGNDYAVHVAQCLTLIIVGKRFGVHPLNFDLSVIFVTCVRQRLGNRQIRVVKLNVLAAQRYFNRLISACNALQHLVPFGQIYYSGVKLQTLAYYFGKIALFKHNGALIEHGHSHILYAALGRNVAEHCNLVAHVLGHRRVHAGDNDVGVDAHTLQLLNRVLGGLGLELLRTGNIGNEGYVYKTAVVAPDFARNLPYSFYKRLTFYIAYCTAYFGDYHVGVGRFAYVIDKRLYFVCNVGNNLNRLSEVFAVALLVQDVPIYFTRGKVGVFVEIFVYKPLVMTEVEVGFRAVVGYENFAVLIGAHRAGVYVDIGVELLGSNLVPPAF